MNNVFAAVHALLGVAVLIVGLRVVRPASTIAGALLSVGGVALLSAGVASPLRVLLEDRASFFLHAFIVGACDAIFGIAAAGSIAWLAREIRARRAGTNRAPVAF